MTDAEIEAINAKASTLMHLGMELLAERRPGAAVEAIECFDRALDARREIPTEGRPFQAYLLAACWLNRADALMQMQDPGRIPAALHSYDEGLALLSELSLDDDARFVRRMAVGHQNRGLALVAGRADDVTPALDAFDAALSLLESATAATLPDRDYLLAGVWTNIAIAQLKASQPDAELRARTGALRAIGLVESTEAVDLDAAEVGLKARHALCQALTSGAEATIVESQTPPDALSEALEHAEAGLRLAARWGERGDQRFWPLAHSLYAFGSAVYTQFQPQFADEFAREFERFR